jgi:general stress protein 26
VTQIPTDGPGEEGSFMADQPRQKFHELLQSFDHAMLVTTAADGHLRSRPMAIADVEPDGDLWFATGVESGKIDEILEHPSVNVSLQANRRFLSLSGNATLVRDRARIDELWNDAWKTWFPGGKDDPHLVLLRVEAVEGEYWDSAGLSGLKYLFEAGKARLSGQTPEVGAEQHGSVRMR